MERVWKCIKMYHQKSVSKCIEVFQSVTKSLSKYQKSVYKCIKVYQNVFDTLWYIFWYTLIHFHTLSYTFLIHFDTLYDDVIPIDFYLLLYNGLFTLCEIYRNREYRWNDFDFKPYLHKCFTIYYLQSKQPLNKIIR